MAVSSNLFQSAIDYAFQGLINYPSDAIKMALLTASASPNLSTWHAYSDLTNEVANGSGYATGGVTLTAKTHVETVANSWGTSWAATNAQNVGDIVIPNTPNGLLYVCVVAGTTGGSHPTWPTVVGESVADNTVTWSAFGESVTVWASAAAAWSSATFSAAYGVIYDAQPLATPYEPLICLVNFGQTLSPVNGALTVSPPANGWFMTAPA